MEVEGDLAAATGAAAAGFFLGFFEVFFGGNATQFEGLIDVAVHDFLNFIHHLLSFDEIFSDRVFEEVEAHFFEGFDSGFVGLHSLHLLLFQFATAFGDGAIEFLSFFIVEEGVNVFAGLLKSRLIQNELAQFTGFINDSSVV